MMSSGRWAVGVAVLATVTLSACGDATAPATTAEAPRTACPDRMARVPGRPVCIDVREARIVGGRAEPATDAPAATDLTWHDAESACRSSGFRLCSIDEFELACAGVDRERRWAYGSEESAHRCNIAEADDDLSARAIVASGTFPDCRTPEGVFDLSGNALEWLADEGGPAGDLRALRGGSAFQPASSARCVLDEAGWLLPDERAGGVRCCASIDGPPSR